MTVQEEENEHLKSVSQEQVAEDFDLLTDTYEDKINETLAFGGREHKFYVDLKRDAILRLVASKFGNLNDLDVLDLGCGVGAYHQGLRGSFRELHGIDVSRRSLQLAKQRHPFVHYEYFQGDIMPYPDNRFDLIFTICVMHHVPPSNWQFFVQEIHRTLKSGGMALVFEHNPYNPATQCIVRTCIIDKNAVLLRPMQLRRLFKNTGFVTVKTRTILSFPPVNTMLSKLDTIFGYLPFGAQYYLSAIKP